MKLRSAFLLVTLAIGCTTAQEQGERSAELVSRIESGSIAAAGCPCSDITAATAADGHVEVFARSNADGSLWRIWESGGAYLAANAQRLTLPGRLIHGIGWVPPEAIERAPTVVLSHADLRLHVFYTRSSDNALIEQVGNGLGTWSKTEISHGAAFHDPAVVELTDESLALVANGGNGQPWVSVRPSGSPTWSAFSLAGTLPAGSVASGRVSPVATDDGALWLFARLGGGDTWYASAPWAGAAFTAWTSLGGYMTFPAAAAVDANGNINLVGVGGDGQIWANVQNERDRKFLGWLPLVSGSVSGVASAANSAPVIGTNVDAMAGSFTRRLEIFFNNNSGNSSGSLWSAAQISPGTWNNWQTGITLPGGYWWAANSTAVAAEADGRLVGFSLDAAGNLRFARADKPVVSLALGSLAGRYHGIASVYKGIPYAQPPIVNAAPLPSLRWQPPRDITAAWGARDAGTFANKCPQKNKPDEGNEDCLYLNVFTPTNSTRLNLPVVVFVHGGGNYNGSSMQYDGASLANRAAQLGTPVVVVTLQYRLGVFSFLTYPGQGTGNYGLQDQIKALEWVSQNIARFGGNPSRVLLFGESGGGRDVELLAASPLTRGRHLFSAAAMESGADVAWMPTLAQGQQNSLVLAQNIGCPNDWNCLMGKRASDLVRAAAALSSANTLMTTIDGTVLTENTRSSLAHNIEVPVIIGANRDEQAITDDPNVPLTPAAYTDYMTTWWSAGQSMNPDKPFDATVLPKILQLYPPIAPDSVRQQIANESDSGLICPGREAARIAVGTGQPVYRYLFTHALEDPLASMDGSHPASTMGAFHTEELAFVFGSLGHLMPLQVPYRPTAAEQALSDTMIGYWMRFAATGDPNGGGAPAWPRYTAWSSTSDPMLELDDTVQMSSGYHIAQCDYIATWL